MLVSGYGSGHKYLSNKQTNNQQRKAFTHNSSIGYSKPSPKTSSNTNTHVKHNQQHKKKRKRRWWLHSHDWTEAKGFEEGEVGGFGEARAENAIINHSKVEGRNERILAVNLTGGTIGGGGIGECVIGDSELNFTAHLIVLVLVPLVVISVLEFCRHLHIKVCFVLFERWEWESLKRVSIV